MQINKNETKMDFATTMAELDLGVTASSVMSDCMKYGMVAGCDPDCPTYQKGTCEQQEENTKQFIEEGLL